MAGIVIFLLVNIQLFFHLFKGAYRKGDSNKLDKWIPKVRLLSYTYRPCVSPPLFYRLVLRETMATMNHPHLKLMNQGFTHNNEGNGYQDKHNA